MSIIGGLGDREGLEFLDIAEVETRREEGKDDKEDLRAAALRWAVDMVAVTVSETIPLAGGRCGIAGPRSDTFMCRVCYGALSEA